MSLSNYDHQSNDPSAKEVADSLDAVTESNGWRAHCPNCSSGDRRQRRSLSISEDGGRTLVRCFRCEDQQGVIDALRHKGLWPDAPEPPSQQKPTRRRRTRRTTRPDRKLALREKVGIDAQRANSQRKREHAIESVQELVARAQLATDHPYLERKQVQPHGALDDGDGRLVVPVYDFDTLELQAAQFIDAEGEKRFKTNTSPKGGVFRIGPEKPTEPVSLDNDTLVIAEGFATAASVYEATGHRAFCTFGTSNLSTIATKARQAWPQANIIIAADNDEHGEGANKANEAARESGASIALPAIVGDHNDYALSHGHEAVREAIDSATAPPSGEDREDFDEDGRPEIRVVQGEYAQTVHSAIAALQAAGVSIYERAGRLVRPLRLEADDDDGSVRRPAGALTLTPTGTSWLRLRLAEAATFSKWYVKQGDWCPIDPPRECAEAIANTPDEGDWPRLRAIVQTPLLWGDGTWAGESGYYNGLLVDVAGGWPAPSTTRQEAEAALATLRHHVRFMPFANDADEAVGVSLLMTAILRPTLANAPLHACDAPTAGTGKSLLVDAAAILATGARASAMDWRDREEGAKRLDAALVAGDPFINLDNVDTALEGATLCSAITQSSTSVRILGKTEAVTVPCASFITATGNNLTVAGDLCQRTVTCRLDAQTDRPDRRKIKQDLIQETRERRGELVAAAQTITRAYIYAGKPNLGLPPARLFHDWTDRVRAPLVWLGMADPADTIDRAIDEDPATRSFYGVLAAWWEALGSQAVTASDLIEEARHDDDLFEQLANICLVRGELDSHTLGYWLRDHRDARSGSLVLQRANRKKSISKWAVTHS